MDSSAPDSSSRDNERIFQAILDFLASAQAAGNEVDRDELHRRFPEIDSSPELAERLDSVLDIPEWFSAPTVEQLPTDLPRSEHRIAKWGEYLLLEEIGRGGMGQVLKAWDMKARRFVALKRLHPNRLSDESICRRFREEPRHVRKLDHEAIVPVLDVGEIDGCPYFTMELVQGASLVHLARHRMLPGDQVAGMMKTIAESVAVAHAAGVLHRDLKPANVLLTTDLEPRLVDFGLAKDVASDSDLTGSLVLGTLNYMSPEQASGRPADVRTDVYGLGAILYELLTARPPFRGATVTELLYKLQHEDVTPPRQVSTDVAAGLEAICLKCLEKDSSRRYSSASDVAKECSRILEGQRQLAPFNTMPRRITRWARQRPAAMAAILLLLATIVSAIGFGSWAVYANNLRRIAEIEKNAAQFEERLAKAITLSLEADSHYHQGRWQEAHSVYQQTIDSGYPDPNGIRLSMAKCLFHLNQTDDARVQLDSLLQKDDLALNHRATALLWRGNVILGHDNKRALADLNAAHQLRAELTPADQKFLAGVRAPKLSEALENFRGAVDIQSHHIEARRMLAACLFFSGQLKECGEEIRTILAFAPDDMPILLLRAVTEEVRGDHQAAMDTLNKAQGTPYESEIPLFRQALNLIHQLSDPRERNSISTTALTFKLAPFVVAATRANSSLNEWGRVPVPPQVYQTYKALFQRTIRALAISNRTGIRDELLIATEDIQEGTLLYVLGRIQIQLGEFTEARESLEAAKRAPQLINVMGDIDFQLARIQWQLSNGTEDSVRDRLREGALKHVQYFVRREVLPPISKTDLVHLAEMSFEHPDFWTSSEVAANWRRRHPGDPTPHLILGIAYLKAKQYAPALTHFEIYRDQGGLVDKVPAYIAFCKEALSWFEALESED